MSRWCESSPFHKPKAVFDLLVTIDEECNFGSSKLAAMAAVMLTNANRAIPIPPEQGEDRSLCIGINQVREERE